MQFKKILWLSGSLYSGQYVSPLFSTEGFSIVFYSCCIYTIRRAAEILDYVLDKRIKSKLRVERALKKCAQIGYVKIAVLFFEGTISGMLYGED